MVQILQKTIDGLAFRFILFFSSFNVKTPIGIMAEPQVYLLEDERLQSIYMSLGNIRQILWTFV